MEKLFRLLSQRISIWWKIPS